MNTSKLILSLVFSFLLGIFIITPKNVYAQSVLFQDNFESGLSPSWNIISGSWSITTDTSYPENGNWLKGFSPPGTDNEIQVGNYNWNNYRLSFDILPKVGADRNIFFRVNNQRTGILTGHNLPVSYSLQPTTGSTYLGKWTINSFGGLPGSPISIPLNSKSHLEINANGNNIDIYLNGTQIIHYQDLVDPILNGRIALGLITGNDPSEVLYDNIIITEVTPTPSPTNVPTPTPSPTATITTTPSATPEPVLPNLNVSDIKQYTLPWGDHYYDKAYYWSSNPTINRWGCALTSAVMILNYYGRNINPDTLNNWLKSQPDGYIGNGLVNWLAVSRYSKLTSNNVLPSLEYSRLPGTLPILINELNNGRPAILEVPGHFVVAKNQTSTSFGINDPAYSDRPTLESYNNLISSIGSFAPSHTDLSYIMLTVNPNIELVVKDPQGNIIPGVYFEQNPIIDDVGNNQNGPPIKIFLYPKPENGEYRVEVSGNQTRFKLNAYIYDRDGNVKTKTFNGKVRNGKTIVYNLEIKTELLNHNKRHFPYWFRFWRKMSH